MKKVIHYINQFFGGIGGESEASCPPKICDGPVGPGVALIDFLGKDFCLEKTIICGDTYFADHTDQALAEILGLIKASECDVVICGPAFNAGRYGLACGRIAAEVSTQLGIPSLTGMYIENPAVDLFKSDTYILPTSDSAKGMKQALQSMAKLAKKLALNEQLGPAEQEGYIPKGLRKNIFAEEIAAERAVKMLLDKINGKPFVSELQLPTTDIIPPPEPIQNMSQAIICLVTEGGLVPKNNPDGVETGRATKWFKYNIELLHDLSEGAYESVHGGYDTVYVNKDPNRLVPLDVCRLKEKAGLFKKLYPYYYVTSGMASAINNCSRMGKEIASELLNNGVSGVIGTST
jgi:betaine reductase